MSAQHSAKKQRVEELRRHYVAKGNPPSHARYKAARKYEVETTSPGIMAWIGGLGLSLASWGLIPLAIWAWEAYFDVPGHTRGVFRWAAWFWVILIALVAVIVVIVLALSGDGERAGAGAQLSQVGLEYALKDELTERYPESAIAAVGCEGGIAVGESVECVIESGGTRHRFEISASGGGDELDLLIDVSE